MEMSLLETLSRLLTNNPELEGLLRDIVEWEKKHPPKDEYDGFAWHDVHGDPRTLNSLVTRKILQIVFKSNKYTGYRLMDLAGMEQALEEWQTNTQPVLEEPQEIPKDLFTVIVGHQDRKEILDRSIRSERPVHDLLWGGPASAKTLFLEELARLPNSHFIMGSNLSAAGIFDVLFNERPRYLILDELDKIEDSANLSALLSLMERGRITETKYHRHRTLILKTWVFAAANSIVGIPIELLSRFAKLHFKDYTPEEFLEVAAVVLTEREGVNENLALYVAKKVLEELRSRDVRDAVRITRLLKEQTREEVDHIVQVLKKQA